MAAGKAGFGRIIGAVLGGGVLGRMVGGELSKLAFNSAMGEKTDVLNDTVKKVAVKAHSKAPKNVKAATTQMRLSKRLRGTYKSFSARR